MMADPKRRMTVAGVDEFLRSQQQPTLLSWLDLADDTSPGDTRRALKERRAWAQAQQSNARHRVQAMWIIRNHADLLHTLVEDPAAYHTLCAALDQYRREELFDQVALACGCADHPDQDPLLLQLKQRMGLADPQATTAQEALPELHEVIARVDASGALPYAIVDGVLRAGRAHGMDDQHIALLLLDELGRAERGLR